MRTPAYPRVSQPPPEASDSTLVPRAIIDYHVALALIDQTLNVLYATACNADEGVDVGELGELNGVRAHC